ncbi:flavin reductase family protein [Brevundimonas sp. SORGH_AS_0993]|uniref:flavin reductase family protein n=1 Tax=Brevundimonas sp. SORGH_AS_0993 TaxID=3041794 RepID=UPI0027D8D57A|nr:flavin reductase family protein [Brevundimonas sp. SORGH_AS_0993]
MVLSSGVETADFRAALASFPAGVTIITTNVEGRLSGTTVSAFSSLSLTPPLVLACLARTSRTLTAVIESGHFCVNILGAGQEDLAYGFARSGTAAEAASRFEGVAFDLGLAGVPVLRHCAATLQCRLHERVAGGDHDILIGRPEHIASNPSVPPLVHGRGRISHLPPA